ncbi:MAG: DUF308 domain-containing protein [Candidatus Hermodarchaeota archaeon]|nr:DUF308 domain-containing protein [Candidatus Hermodarchaeota archaeon]
MNEVRPKLWLRVTEIILGLLALIASFFIMVFPVFSLDLFILLIALGLVGLGLARILRGLFSKVLSRIKREFSIVVGFILLVGSLFIFLNPSIATFLSFWILAAILSALGLVRIFIGALTKNYPQKLKYTLVILGTITLLLALMAFVLPLTIGYLVIYLLAIGLLTAGIGRITLGLFGFK